MLDCSIPVRQNDGQLQRGRARSPWLAIVAVGLLTALLVIAPATTPAAAQPAPGPPQTVDGPSADIVSLGGMAIARDGSGGLVYLKMVDGIDHVFVSPLVGGVFQPPQQIDAALGGASSQPVIAAGNGGVLLVAFINGGELYAAEDPGSTAGWQAPQALYAGAQNPSIQMDNFGVGYLAFTASAGAGHDVLAEYFNGSGWALASPAMNVTPGDDAGTGSGRPEVATAGDGVGIVAWGEGGHVYARRVWTTGTSIDYEQLDPATFQGATEEGASSPAISVGGDSSYVDVAFEEQLAGGSSTQTRVLMSRLIAENAAPAVAADGMSTPGDTSADQPAVAMNEYGRGFVTAGQASDDDPFATILGTNGSPTGSVGVDPTPNSSAPDAVPALAGLSSTLIAWQQTPMSGASQVVVRYAQGGTNLGPPTTLSAGAGGPTHADEGLAAGGDNEGDAAVAWAQGVPGLLSIDTAQLYQAPGQTMPATKLVYTRQPQPLLSWSAAREEWGQLTYTVTLGGTTIGQTTGTSLPVPSALIDGPHVWQVTATNAGGLKDAGGRATVFVDTVPPRVRFALTGRPRAHDLVTVRLAAVDAPPPVPGAQASGIASIQLTWGDGTPAITRARLTRSEHDYQLAGLYRIAIRVTDRAGNVTTVQRYLRILP